MAAVIAARLPRPGTAGLVLPQPPPGTGGWSCQRGWEGSAHPEPSWDPRGHPHSPRQQLGLGTGGAVLCRAPVVPRAGSCSAGPGHSP